MLFLFLILFFQANIYVVDFGFDLLTFTMKQIAFHLHPALAGLNSILFLVCFC